jgi:hypothetical protein
MSLRVIFAPILITLAVTILRLIGEMRRWPAKWFSPETGGIVPSGVSWVIGITWLTGMLSAACLRARLCIRNTLQSRDRQGAVEEDADLVRRRPGMRLAQPSIPDGHAPSVPKGSYGRVEVQSPEAQFPRDLLGI